MSFRMNNNRGLERLLSKAKGDPEKDVVGIEDLLNPAFIKAHTKHGDLRSLIVASGVTIADDSNGEELASDEFSKFVSSNTAFPTFMEMLKVARIEHVKNKLGTKQHD